MTQPKLSREFVDQVKEVSGLPRHIVRDLLYLGWTFVDSIGEPRKWIGPELNLEIPRNEVPILEN